MGLIGDILYPDNAEKARELNKEQETLEKTNALHNSLVNSYAILADKIRTFDAYLMAVLVMQYHIAYTKEDLDNLPETTIPKLTQSIADKIETAALDAMSINMGLRGLKAIGQKIGNIVRESGSYKSSIKSGKDAVSKELESDLNELSTKTDLVRSGNVELLTKTDTPPSDLSQLGEELETITNKLEDVQDTLEDGGDIPETVNSAVEGAQSTLDLTTLATEAEETASVAGLESTIAGAGEAVASILGPATIILIVVTEIIGAIDASQTHDTLEKALAQMKKLQNQSDKSLTMLKKAFKALLTCAQLDIKAYNKILRKLYQLEGSQVYNTSYEFDGINSFLKSLDDININNSNAIAGYQAAAIGNLKPVTDAIRQQAEHDSTMTDVISRIKTHLRTTGLKTADDDYLQDLAAVENLSLARVRDFNVFRQFIAEFASALKPYHEQVRKNTPVNSKLPIRPANPTFGKPNPSFDPKPSDFEIPGF